MFDRKCCGRPAREEAPSLCGQAREGAIAKGSNNYCVCSFGTVRAIVAQLILLFRRAADLPVILLAAVLPLAAQVSPGPLSKAHHSLDSPLKCGSCHVFGAGSPRLKCLICHGEIRALVKDGKGYHGRVVKKGDADCARCHTEHYGLNLRIYKWETSKEEFDHRQTGYPLVGRHAGLSCEKCHNATHISTADRKRIRVRDLNQTFEGLHTACLTCHEDRHAGQLGVDCEKCHEVSGWKPLKGFDHSTTHFPLDGKHRDVECAKCHKPLATNAKVIQYTGLSFAACTGCHQDPHRGAFPNRCESCHNVDAWKQVRMSSSFDHSATKFPLLGKHQQVACLKCHRDANFKTPVAHEKCLDCHQDQHRGQFQHRPDRGDCASCHGLNGWKPTTFTETSHQSTAYPLAGKHRSVACAKCHVPVDRDSNYHPTFKACLDCHRDPHGGQFAGPPRNNRCEDCHTVEGFHPSTFGLKQHQTSRFSLKGAHAAVACEDCHKKTDAAGGVPYHFASLACDGCHRDPHRGQFPETMTSHLSAGQSVCESCHSLVSWQQLKPFDHSQTRFDLTGGHRALGCLSCHIVRNPDERPRTVAFKTSSEKCDGCHEDIHEGQFQRGTEKVDCARCHNTSRWLATEFDHEKTNFSLQGAHKDVPCRLCHKAQREANGRMVVRYNGVGRECISCHR